MGADVMIEAERKKAGRGTALDSDSSENLPMVLNSTHKKIILQDPISL